MSDSVRPHRRQPTRLHCPWDSPGKSTGVGCHFLLQCMKVKSESEVAQLCPTLSDPMDCSPPCSSVQGIFQARVLEWSAIIWSQRSVSLHSPPMISLSPHRLLLFMLTFLDCLLQEQLDCPHWTSSHLWVLLLHYGARSKLILHSRQTVLPLSYKSS